MIVSLVLLDLCVQQLLNLQLSVPLDFIVLELQFLRTFSLSLIITIQFLL